MFFTTLPSSFPVIKQIYLGIDAYVDLPTSSGSIDSYLFKGETKKRPFYRGSFCDLKKEGGVRGAITIACL